MVNDGVQCRMHASRLAGILQNACAVESTAHAFKPFCILSIELCIQTKHSYLKRKLHSLSVSDCVLCYWTSISIIYRSIIINFQLYIHTRRGLVPNSYMFLKAYLFKYNYRSFLSTMKTQKFTYSQKKNAIP